MDKEKGISLIGWLCLTFMVGLIAHAAILIFAS